MSVIAYFAFLGAWFKVFKVEVFVSIFNLSPIFFDTSFTVSPSKISEIVTSTPNSSSISCKSLIIKIELPPLAKKELLELIEFLSLDNKKAKILITFSSTKLLSSN